MKKLGLVLLFCLSWALSYALNLRQLIGLSRQYLGDSPFYTPIPKLSDRRITDYLNEGQRFAASYEWMLVRRTTFSLLANTTEYALPVDFQTVNKLYLNGKPLPETTLDALDADGVNWLLPSGTANKYYVRFATVSVIGFIPWPTSSVLPLNVVMDYKSQVQDMVSLLDVPFNGSPEFAGLHSALCKYVAYRYLLSTGQIQAADVWGREYLSDIKRMIQIIEVKPNYRPGLSVLEPQR